MPRGTRRTAQPAPTSPPDATPAPSSPPRATRLPGKKRTVADNAVAIDSLHGKLETMSALLNQVIGHVQPSQPEHAASPAPYSYPASPYLAEPPARARHRSDAVYNDSISQSRQRYKSSSYPAAGTGRPIHESGHDITYGREAPYDPASARMAPPSRRRLPSALQDLDESTDLQDRVAHIVSAALVPPHLSGKRMFAHSYVRRGTKKVKTSLGELTLAEYNTGFIKLMNSREVDSLDRPQMLQHLERVNEDAITHPFSDVRAWSEEVCLSVAEGDLRWDDHYKIDLLRITMSQNGPAGRTQGGDRRDAPRRAADTGALDPQSDFSPDILTARPGPPCRSFNSGSCSHRSHHVSNGFRQLHVCSSCIYHKCLLIPHSEKDCKSKEYRKRQAARDGDLGFGK